MHINILLLSIYSFFSIIPLAQIEPSKPQSVAVNFYYPLSKYKMKVTKEIATYFKELNAYIDNNPESVIYLSGYAQDGPNEEWNMRVSKYRTRHLRDLLLALGIPTQKIKIEYFGRKAPISKDDSPQELAKNRRVELRIR